MSRSELEMLREENRRLKLQLAEHMDTLGLEVKRGYDRGFHDALGKVCEYATAIDSVTNG